MLIAVEGTGENQLEPGQENMGDARALQNSLTKTYRCAGALS